MQQVDVGYQRLQLALHHNPKSQHQALQQLSAQHLKECKQRNTQVRRRLHQRIFQPL